MDISIKLGNNKITVKELQITQKVGKHYVAG